MNKRFIPLLCLPLLLTPLFSCQSNSDKIAYFKGDGNIALLDGASDSRSANSDLVTMLKRKNSFIFYVSDSSCSSCNEFESMLKPYLSESKLLIYKLSTRLYSLMSSSHKSTYGLPATVSTPTLFFIKNGSVARRLSFNDDSKIFTNSDNFDKYIKRYGTFTDLTYHMPSTTTTNETTYSLTYDSSFLLEGTKDVVLYETLSNNYNELLLGLDSSSYVSDITSFVVDSSGQTIDNNALSSFKETMSIPADRTFPVEVSIVDGKVTSIK